MSEEKELKLACLHQAGGDLDHAQRLFDWVSGSVRATPDSEAAEVSAPKQDKPQQSFNYRHPSKYGTDVPRRCYLEELTPEERAIRDLVDTVERLGAHPLLTATVIQLMKAGEDLADWVDIGLRDKDIAALSPGSDLGLLDENPAAGDTEVRNQAEDEAPLDVQAAGLENDPLAAALLQEAMDSGHADGPRVGQFVRHDWVDGTSPGYGNITTCKLCGRVKRASNEFGPCPEANRSEFVEPSTDAERLSVVTDQDRVEQADLLLENQPGVSSQASLAEAAVPEGWTPAAEFQFDGLIKANQRVPVVMALYEDGVSCPGGNGIIGAWTFPVRDVPVIAYRIIPTPPGLIEASADAERIEVASEPQTTNEQEQKDEGLPILDAGDIAEVLREGVPADALLSTFADGKLYATFGGSTYLVIDSPKDADAFKETDASAAYAHINEIDEPAGDAAVFARGMMEEAKEPQPPSWLSMFMGKAKVDA